MRFPPWAAAAQHIPILVLFLKPLLAAFRSSPSCAPFIHPSMAGSSDAVRVAGRVQLLFLLVSSLSLLLAVGRVPRAAAQSGVGGIITQSVYNSMFLHTNDARCAAVGFFTYKAFITAAASFPKFGTQGTTQVRKRELAAFLAQVSHETTGGWPTADDGPYAWGLCFKTEIGCPSTYCQQSTQWPCAAGKRYCGRGPIQLSWNYNYGQAGRAIGQPLLTNPELVANDRVVAWKTAIWFWMTAQSPKPSAHAVMVGQWTPSAADRAANRLPGLGVTTNIINGALECGRPGNAAVADRIGYFRRYCQILGVSTGSNLDCGNQQSW